MKRTLSTLLLSALLWLCACSNTEVIRDVETPERVDTSDYNFVCFNICQPANQSTKAGDNGYWDFEPGSQTENNVSSIRFYFFNDNGDIVKVKNGNTAINLFLDYYEWTPEAGEENTQSLPDNIEKEISSFLKLRFENDETPSRFLTVVNPKSDLNELLNPSFTELRDKISDLSAGLSDTDFVMTNTVYLSSNNSPEEGGLKWNTICATPISDANICATQAEALANKVEVYVERVVARLDLEFKMAQAEGFNSPEGSMVFKTNVKIKTEGSDAEKDVFVEFLGWAVTSSPKNSRLFKKIDPKWDPESIFSSSLSWNSAAYRRSAWAINPEETEYFWFTYNDLTKPDLEGNRVPGVNDMTVARAYMQENANPYAGGETITLSAPNYPTKVIFAARIIDNAGTPLDMAEYGGKYYSTSNLMEIIADRLDMYYPTNGVDGNNNTIYSKISYSDLDFETSMERGENPGPHQKDTYYVYFKLKESQPQKTWYHSFPTDQNPENFKIADPQAYIDSMVSKVKVWSEGRTYFYFDIPHCQEVAEDQPGYYGVVRNNLYNASVLNISHLGTPVYRPGEIIYPETPEESDVQLVVRVNTMQWRVERQDVELSW